MPRKNGKTKNQPDTLGARLKVRRTALALSQAALAERCGVHQGNIARYELGTRQPGATHLRKIADALGCTIDELVP